MGNEDLSVIAKTEGYSKYKRVTTTTASTYYVLVTDYLINPVANTNDITYILPKQSLLRDGIIQELIIINNVVSGNSITVQCYPGDTFIHGNTKYILPSNMGDIRLMLSKNGFLVSDDIVATVTTQCPSGSIANTLTTIPYNNELLNTQPEFFDTDTTGEITILTSGLYDIYFSMAYNNLSSLVINGDIYQNSGKIDGTYFYFNSLAYEGGYVSTVSGGIELEAGDIITVRAIGVGSPNSSTIINSYLTMVLKLG